METTEIKVGGHTVTTRAWYAPGETGVQVLHTEVRVDVDDWTATTLEHPSVTPEA